MVLLLFSWTSAFPFSRKNDCLNRSHYLNDFLIMVYLHIITKLQGIRVDLLPKLFLSGTFPFGNFQARG